MKPDNISEGYKDIRVSVIDYNMNIAKHAWDCYKMTWTSLQNVDYDPTDPRVVEAVNNIIRFRALPMPREQAILTFKIEIVSQRFLAHRARHSSARLNVDEQMPL